jgi:hypothetical protein
VVKLLRFAEKAGAFTRIAPIGADFSLNTEQEILTAEYAEKTDSIQPLQFRVFSVFRGSISRKYQRGPIPRPNLPQKNAKNAKKSLHRFHEFALISEIRVKAVL